MLPQAKTRRLFIPGYYSGYSNNKMSLDIAIALAYLTGRSIAERVVQQLNGRRSAPDLGILSNRELEIMQRIVAGERLVDIAHALHLSIKTISTHKSRIQEKLELPTLADLVRYGLEHGLVADGTPTGEIRPPAQTPAARPR